MATSTRNAQLPNPVGRPTLVPNEELLERLETAATYLISKRGYESVSMNDVATQVGVAKPALYRLFPSKSALYSHLLLTSANAASSAALTASRPFTPHLDIGTMDPIRAIVSSWFDAVETNPARWMLLATATPVDESVAVLLRQIRRTQIANDIYLIATFAPHIPTSQHEPIAEALRGSLLQLAMWWLRDFNITTPQQNFRRSPRFSERKQSAVDAMTRISHGLLTATTPL